MLRVRGTYHDCADAIYIIIIIYVNGQGRPQSDCIRDDDPTTKVKVPNPVNLV